MILMAMAVALGFEGQIANSEFVSAPLPGVATGAMVFTEWLWRACEFLRRRRKAM